MVIAACHRDKNDYNVGNTIKLNPSSEKTGGGSTYLMSAYVGHSAKDCSGCVCVGGVWQHQDCQGTGNACLAMASVSLAEIGDGIYTATTMDASELTGEDFFNMPARSLCVQVALDGKRTYLNIPAQLVFRDSTTRQFTFTGLFYSERAAYSNN